MTSPRTLRRTGMVYARAACEVAVLAAVREPTHWDRISVSLVPDPLTSPQSVTGGSPRGRFEWGDDADGPYCCGKRTWNS